MTVKNYPLDANTAAWITSGWDNTTFTVYSGGHCWALRNNRKHKGMYARFKAMYDLVATRDGETVKITMEEYRFLRDGK